MKKLFGLPFLLLLLPLSFAFVTYEYPLYNMNFSVDFPERSAYSSGDEIPFKVTLENNSGYVFTGKLVYTLVYGSEAPDFATTSQLEEINDSDVVTRVWYEDVQVPPGKILEKEISVKVPSSARSGVWRVDFYLMGYKQGIFGNYVSFYPYTYFTFNVNGSGNLPALLVLRKKTHLAGGYLQSGPSANPGVDLPAELFLRNMTNEDLNFEVKVEICKFDDYTGDCTPFKTYTVYVPANSDGKLSYTISFPSPGAYSVVYKVYLDGELHAIYKNRIIINGGGPNVIDMTVSFDRLVSGRETAGRVVVTGPFEPSTGKTKNVRYRVYIESDGKEVFSKEYTVDSLETGEARVEFFEFTPTVDADDFSLCVDTGVAECVRFTPFESEEEVVPTSTQESGQEKPEEQPLEEWEGVEKVGEEGEPGEKGTFGDTTPYIAVALAVLVAVVILMLRKRRGTATVFLSLFTLFVFFTSFGYSSCHYSFYYDGRDITGLVENYLKNGDIYTLPVGTTIEVSGTMSFKVEHHCGNTARWHSTCYADCGFDVAPKDSKVSYQYRYEHIYVLSDLDKEEVVDSILGGVTLSDGCSGDEVNRSKLLESLESLNDIYPFPSEVSSNVFEDAIMNKLMSKYCEETGCTYDEVSTSLGTVSYDDGCTANIYWESVFRGFNDRGLVSTVRPVEIVDAQDIYCSGCTQYSVSGSADVVKLKIVTHRLNSRC